MAKESIIIKGARVHNLKNIDLKIPRDQLVVITGLSGSGKSSLAFDTIYAEGQRRYVESLSAYARQFLGQMDKPDVDYIEGLSPAISIDQKTTSRNPRSTVGTVTEIYDYLRLLYANIGKVHCYKCGKPISRQTVEQIVDKLMLFPENTHILVLAPLVRGRKGEHQKVFEDIRRKGFVRVRVDGEIKEASEEIILDKQKKHSIEAVIDRLIIRPGIEKRLADSLETALKLGEGLVAINASALGEFLFSEKLACPDCGISFEEMSPRMFSFNNPFGACTHCGGLGFTLEIDPDLVVRDQEKTLAAGAIEPWSKGSSPWYMGILESLSREYGFSMHQKYKELSEQQKKAILYGTGNKKIRFSYHNNQGDLRLFDTIFEGVIPNLQRRYKETQSDFSRQEIEQYMGSNECPQCRGARLKPEVLAVRVNNRNIWETTCLSVKDASRFFLDLQLTEREKHISRQILKEINSRLNFLANVGLDYLTLNRSAGSLSGGEAQRIRLATQIGSSLVGVLYILDEPSIGLHQRDNNRLIETLKSLRDLGNSVLVVEHDTDMILTADHIIDMGPGAGINGGNIVAQGKIEDIKNEESSITGAYLNERLRIPIPSSRRQKNGKELGVYGARANNLKNINITFPLNMFVCVTGVSGSGKSSLVNEIIYRHLANCLNRARTKAGGFDRISGLENLEKVIAIDQAPIGRTPRSNPATYTGVFDGIREVFASTPEARARGYKSGRFSFNVKGGRCEACGGDGIIKIEMHFLSDVYVPCELCKGKRYNRETLEVRYKGKNIAQVLEMTVDEAADFFQNHPKIYRRLNTMQEVGLGYIRLGQPATTLSGGEAQRVKLSTELSRRSNGKTLYILDEPTTGLHIADIHKLLEVLNRLVEAGDSVLVIEHNLDVIKTADHIIDLGPEGGDKGGEVLATGTPEEVSKVEKSYTGKYLKRVLYQKDK